MIGSDYWEWIPLVVGYAETHYRFRFFPFSLYYRRQPEIVFDAPHRLEPSAELPITLLIKDADKFPTHLEEVILKVTSAEKTIDKTFKLNEPIITPFWHRCFDLDVDQLPPGSLTVKATACVHGKRRSFLVFQDNYHRLSHAPLKVYKAADPLPNLPDWRAGELHCHTDFGCDHVEFGAPLDVYQRSAQAMGLEWVALTDHSYNLDDLPDNYLKDDPKRTKWNHFLHRVQEMNTDGKVLLIPGEELSCRSASGKNVHMLILGDPNFHRGTGDDAQKWLQTHSELTVDEALDRVSRESFIAAAHPFARIGLLEKLLVNRGRWEDQDLEHTRLNGWQILNSRTDPEFPQGLSAWSNALLKGNRRYIYAGNDAHGNMNRFRQVKLPMIKLWEHHHHLFGQAITRFKCSGSLSVSTALSALKSGKISIGDGPTLEMTVEQNGRLSSTGSEINVSDGGHIILRYASSAEFGTAEQLSVYTAGSNSENCLFELGKGDRTFPHPYREEIKISLGGISYIRAELKTRTSSDTENHSFTNPIWLKIH